MTQTALVTGGAGFIGSCVVRQFIRKHGVRVVNVDKLTYAGNLDSLRAVWDDPLHVFVQADIRDSSRIGQLLEEYRPRTIINLAAESHVDRSIDDSSEFVDTNVVGAVRLFEEARRYWSGLGPSDAAAFRVLQVSTDEVYGSLGPEGFFTEDTPYQPNSPYAASKAAADHFARAYFHTYGLPVIVTNSSNNYGPYQFPEKLIPLVILNSLEGRAIPVYGDGQNVRDWLYVEDHADALLLVAARGVPGSVYNVGARCQRTNLDVARAICDTVDRLRPDLPHIPCRQLITFVEDRPGHDRRYAIDPTRIRHELGWRPTHPFQTGLEDTVRWYLANSPWLDGSSSGPYERERLGLNTDPK